MKEIRFRSFRTKLRAAFVLLGLAAIGITGWEASAGAASALREATFNRLTAIRETKAAQIERYFEDLRKHVVALSTDETTIAAIEAFAQTWKTLPGVETGSERERSLGEFYADELRTRGSLHAADKSFPSGWFPSDPRTRSLQYAFLAGNPHPAGARDLLLTTSEAGQYGAVHARYHPTFHRYRSAFGFYDILLISAQDARVLYTVLKEIDLGMSLTEPPFSSTALASANRRALTLADGDEAVLEDYAEYPASYFAPAAFAAAPVRRGGAPIGVLAIQVSIQEVNRVIAGAGSLRQEGLGETGQAYAVGSDTLLRSDLRSLIEKPEEFLRELQQTGVPPAEVAKIRANRTAVLALPVIPEVAEQVRRGGSETSTGKNRRGVEVLRSHAPLKVNGLDWTVVAEIDSREALAPVGALQRRILVIGLIVSLLFFGAAGWLAASVTRPILGLAKNVRELGSGTLGMQVPVESSDEVGQLTESFNRMSEDLRKTTVSKSELEVLAGRLISAQEEERSRVARELHDDFSQRVAAMAMEAGRLEKLSDAESGARKTGLERLKQQIAGVAEDVHSLSRRLHPAILDDLGLVAAVETECRGFLERGGPWVDFAADGDFQKVSREVQLALYRIVQESLRNIQRHSGATEITLRLRASGDEAELTIEDNGQGFDRNSSAWRPGLGLASMEERTRLLGGYFNVRSRPGEGTTIKVNLPMRGTNGKTENPAG